EPAGVRHHARGEVGVAARGVLAAAGGLVVLGRGAARGQRERGDGRERGDLSRSLHLIAPVVLVAGPRRERTPGPSRAPLHGRTGPSASMDRTLISPRGRARYLPVTRALRYASVTLRLRRDTPLSTGRDRFTRRDRRRRAPGAACPRRSRARPPAGPPGGCRSRARRACACPGAPSRPAPWSGTTRSPRRRATAR